MEERKGERGDREREKYRERGNSLGRKGQSGPPTRGSVSGGVGVAFLSDTQLEHFSPLFPITENDHQGPAPPPHTLTTFVTKYEFNFSSRYSNEQVIF